MSDTPSPLAVTVTLAPVLWDALDDTRPLASLLVEARLSETLAELRACRAPSVSFAEGDPDFAELVGLRVDGRQCPFRSAIVAETLAYIDGTSRLATDAEVVVADLGTGDAERVAEFLGAVCAAAIAAQPAILLTAEDDPAIHAAADLGMPIGVEASPTRDAHGGDPAERRISALASPTVDAHVDPVLLRQLTTADGAGEAFPSLGRYLFDEFGLAPSALHLRPDASLRPSGFAFRINGVRMPARIALPVDMILAYEPAGSETLTALGAAGEPALIPGTRRVGALVAAEHEALLQAAGVVTWDRLEHFIGCFAAALRASASSLITSEVAAAMTDRLAEAFPVLGEAAARHVPGDTLAPVLRDLLRDGIPIQNLRRILELLLVYETAGGADRCPDRMAFVRMGLADLIAATASYETSAVVVYLLDPELEHALDGDPDPGGPASERIRAALAAELSYLPKTARAPALLSRDELRRPLRAALRHEFPEIMVLAFGDLPPSFAVQPVARISSA